MEVIRSSLLCFFVLVYITHQKIIFTDGRHLNIKNKVRHSEGGRRRLQDDGSRILEKIKVAAKPSHGTHLGKRDAVQDQNAQQSVSGKGSLVEPSTGHETPLDMGKYHLENTQQGHSPGVGHPFVTSEDVKEQTEQANVEGKTHDYSPGVGHSVPPTDGYAKHEAAGGGTSIMADKRIAGGKSGDYSPGVGHSFPGSHDHGTTVSARNNNYLREERFKDERVATDKHSPGVGHSIQGKHAEPRAGK